MRTLFLVPFALLSVVRAEPVEARAQSAPPVARPSTSSGRTVEGVDQIARRYALAGEVLVAKGDKVLLDEGYGPVAPNGKAMHTAGQRWRLASITKQVTAALLLRKEFAALDKPVSRTDHEPVAGATLAVTLRQLLTHHSGLANPDTTPSNSEGVPEFYRISDRSLRFCLSKAPQPGSEFSYNNCDYIVAAAEFGGVGRWPPGMKVAKDGETGVVGFVGGKPEPAFELASWGAAGGLIGTARAVFHFDRSLMTGRLLPSFARDELWKPEGGRSYQALGQWVFPGTLKGCAAPKRIVQRDGEIYGVQARNFIFPDDDLVVIVFTNRGSDDFPLGEVWEGKGFVYDLLSAVACS